jgi:hypothetical protein
MVDGVVSATEGRLLLLANGADEVPLVSALMQDAVVHATDIAWEPRARRLVLLVNRFRWETGDLTRVRAALRIEGVTRVQRRDWPRGDAILDLLAVTAEVLGDGAILTLAFAAGATLRADVEVVDVIVEDMGAAWPALRAPHHDAR